MARAVAKGERRGVSRPLFSIAPSPSHPLAGQKARLLHPGGELRFVEPVVLADVEVAHVLLPGLARREGTQSRAAEESHLHVLREAMKAEEPGLTLGLTLSLALDAIEGRVPFDRLGDTGTVRTMSASRRRPTSRFQPGMAA
jgi:hypothetical protein